MIAFIHGGDPKKIEYATHSLAIIPAAGGAAKVLTPDLDRNVVHRAGRQMGNRSSPWSKTMARKISCRVPLDWRRAAEPVVGGRRTVTCLRREQGRQSHCAGEHAGSPLRDLRGGEWRAALPDETERRLPRADPTRPGRRNKVQESGRNRGARLPRFIRLTKSQDRKVPLCSVRTAGRNRNTQNEFEFEKQLFAANGYAVMMPNPRGSTGRGTEYAMGIYASWGERDVRGRPRGGRTTRSRGASPIRIVWSSAAGVTAVCRPTT